MSTTNRSDLNNPNGPETNRPAKSTVHNRTLNPVPVETDGVPDPISVPANFRILSIDGGGSRGMIPAVILKEVEQRSGKRISELFNRITGTSTGSILACGLAAPETPGSSTPRFRAGEIVEIYRALGPEIFVRGSFAETVIQPMEELLDRDWTYIAAHFFESWETLRTVWNLINRPLHQIHKLAYKLHEYLGDLKMKDALTELFVYAYDIGSRTPQILGSTESLIPGEAYNYANFRMYQAATASSAAVPFFAPYTVWAHPNPPTFQDNPWPAEDIYLEVPGSGNHYDLVDGGNGGLGNPALLAMLEETELSAGHHKIVLSIGTGHFSEPIPPEAKSWGFLQWLGEGGELLKSMFDGEADVVDMALRQMLDKDISYFRWQPSIPESLAFLDEGDPDDMDMLEDVAQTFISENDEAIDAFVALLEQTNRAHPGMIHV